MHTPPLALAKISHKAYYLSAPTTGTRTVTDVLDRLKTALSDRYTIERESGAGGMATVYLAHDLKHDRKVAVSIGLTIWPLLWWR